MSTSKTDKRKENGFAESTDGVASSVFTGPDYASSSKYVSLTGDSGYDDDFYGGAGVGTTQYVRTEVDEEDELEAPPVQGSSMLVESRHKALARGKKFLCTLHLAKSVLIYKFPV